MEKKLTKVVDSEDVLGIFMRRKLDMTRHQIRQAKYRENGICVNGERSYTNRRLFPGDVVEVYLETPQETSLPRCPMDPEVKILYEDEDMIVVTKPAGMVIHPSHGHYEGCLGGMIASYYEERGIQTKIRPVGRLDKDTSGVMVFAKNQISAARLYEQKKDGRFQKEYLAVVRGKPEPLEGIIDVGICKDEASLMKMRTEKNGPRAVTHYKTVECLGDKTLISVKIETGRTHQIRVHMASIGHPLLGDPLYGKIVCTENLAVPKELTACEKTVLIDRTALHAWKCRLYQPFTGELLEFQAEIPKDMKEYMRRNI